MSTLYEKLGGEAAVEAAVVRFYEKIMADPSVARFFEDMNIESQVNKQIAFLTMAFGGPHSYTGRDLREAHEAPRKNGLGDEHFDTIAMHLRTTLHELNVNTQIIEEVMSVVASTRADVLDLP